MNIRVFQREHQVTSAAAFILASQLLKKPDSVLGLPTGSTPIPVYKELIRLTQNGILDWSRVRTFNLDEYVGLTADHPESYHQFMRQNLFSGVNLAAENIYLLDGVAADLQKECLTYEQKIRAAGGIDFQFLGLGRNGHIGFNEPDEVMPAMTHVVDLTEDTLEANARFFVDNPEEQPKQALSMGVGSIMQAREIMLVATGAGKARAVKQMICGPVDPQCPASILQVHSNVTILLDEAAATMLKCC